MGWVLPDRLTPNHDLEKGIPSKNLKTHPVQRLTWYWYVRGDGGNTKVSFYAAFATALLHFVRSGWSEQLLDYPILAKKAMD